MPIEKVNVYARCSCPMMGIDNFGSTPLTYFMELQVSFNLGAVCCKLLFYCYIPINNTKLLGKEVNLHPK